MKRVVAAFAYPFARAFTQRFSMRWANSATIHPPVFIIGAPRTGSTILYQALTNYFDVLYIDNVACHLHSSLPLGMWVSRRLYGNRPHGNFEARHGATVGGHAPSECGGFWYRWLPRESHFVDFGDVGEEDVRQIRDEVASVSAAYSRPFLIKNMNAGQRLRLLQRCFPNAKFIHVKRDPVRVIESIMRVRKRLRTPVGELWSIKPNGYEMLLELDELEMVAAQVAAIERQIEADRSLFPEENFITVRFNEMSPSLMEDIGVFMGVERRPGGSLPGFIPDVPSEVESEELRRVVAKYFPTESEA